MRIWASVAFLGLTACGAPVSDDVYALEREAELMGDDPVITPAPGAWNDPTGGASDPVISSDELAAAGIPVDGAPQSPGSSTEAASANAATNDAGLSREQSFEAVSARQTIESDAERLERMQQAYRVIEPQPLPDRPAEAQPNIVAYAINTTNDPGEPLYSRSSFNVLDGFNRDCADFGSADAAQRAFLSRGGPQRDALGLDPDGDGFACGWDPTPFRTR